jgi:hypothetical protein
VIKPAPAWRFTVTLPDLPGQQAAGQTIHLLVERFTSTHKGLDYEPAPFNAGSRNFPTARVTDGITITFAETSGYDVIRLFRSWKNLVIDDDGNFGLPSQWKKDITLSPLDETGDSVGSFRYTGCSPARVDPYEYDGAHTSHVSAVVSFSVDNSDPFA